MSYYLIAAYVISITILVTYAAYTIHGYYEYKDK